MRYACHLRLSLYYFQPHPTLQPIHIPGAVQGFGVLIALEEDLDTGNLVVRVVSEVRVFTESVERYGITTFVMRTLWTIIGCHRIVRKFWA